MKNNNGRYEFDVYHKLALADVKIKLHSYISLDTVTIFKLFLPRATKIFSENI